jgi:hypothetical protein
MNEVFTKWREAIEYAEQRRGVRDFIENRQANALVECANEVRRLDTELAVLKSQVCWTCADFAIRPGGHGVCERYLAPRDTWSKCESWRPKGGDND